MDVQQHEPQPAERLHTVQVGKADAFGIVTWGPVHVWSVAYRLTWCGRRMKGIRSRGSRVDSVAQIKTGAVCPVCARAISTGRPRAYKG